MTQRWTEPPVGVRYDADGTRVEDADPEVLDRIQAIAEGWRILDETGDQTVLVKLSILEED